MTRPCDLNATEARKLIGNKQLSPVELTKSCIDQIDKFNPSINAVVAIDKNEVLKQARKAEDDIMSGSDLGLLHGLPVGIKDLNLVNFLLYSPTTFETMCITCEYFSIIKLSVTFTVFILETFSESFLPKSKSIKCSDSSFLSFKRSFE